MSNVARITEFEIQAKVAAAVHAEATKGKAVSDFSKREMHSIADAALAGMSPEAKKALIRAGVQHMVESVLGENVAERIWHTGKGWSITDEEVKQIGREMKFETADEAVDCLQTFKGDLQDLTREDLEEREFVKRFAPLFLTQPSDATLGEVATVKAARGDKLALSFLAWREIP